MDKGFAAFFYFENKKVVLTRESRRKTSLRKKIRRRDPVMKRTSRTENRKNRVINLITYQGGVKYRRI